MTCTRLTTWHLTNTLPDSGFKVFLQTNAVFTARWNLLHGVFSLNYSSWKRGHGNGQRAVFGEGKWMLPGASTPQLEGGLREAASRGESWWAHTSWFRSPLCISSKPSSTTSRTHWKMPERCLPMSSARQESVHLNGEQRTMKWKFWGSIMNTWHCQCQEGLYWNPSEAWNTLRFNRESGKTNGYIKVLRVSDIDFTSFTLQILVQISLL